MSFTVQSPLLSDKPDSHRRSSLFYASVALLSTAVLAGLVVGVLWQVGVFDSDSEDSGGGGPTGISNKYLVYGDDSLCNDGTRAVFYLRRNESNTKWLVRFQGGGMCWNDESCLDRAESKPSYVSSIGSPVFYEFDTAGGIMQASQDHNPHFWDWNAAHFSYCSSDMWLGDSPEPNSIGFVFNGKILFENGLRTLFGSHGMSTATEILLLGEGMACSIPLNYGTRAQELAAEYGPARVGGIVDSGWWVNVTYPNTSTECISEETCPTSSIFDVALPYLGGEQSVDPNCLLAFGEPHWCMWSPIVYQTRTIPIFISQNLYDISMCQSAGSPLGSPKEGTEYWNFSVAMAEVILETYELAGVTDTWSASCGFAHALESPGYHQTLVKDTLLGEAIAQWWAGSPAEFIDDCRYPECNPTCVAVPE